MDPSDHDERRRRKLDVEEDLSPILGGYHVGLPFFQSPLCRRLHLAFRAFALANENGPPEVGSTDDRRPSEHTPLLKRFQESPKERIVELLDENLDRSTAGEADVPGGLVRDAEPQELGRTRLEDLAALFHHRGLDAPSAHRPGDAGVLGQAIFAPGPRGPETQVRTTVARATSSPPAFQRSTSLATSRKVPGLPGGRLQSAQRMTGVAFSSSRATGAMPPGDESRARPIAGHHSGVAVRSPARP
jgi:hypothetical protein